MVGERHGRCTLCVNRPLLLGIESLYLDWSAGGVEMYRWVGWLDVSRSVAEGHASDM